MAGLKFDDRAPRMISARTHAVIDYIHAATNFAVGFWLRERNRTASNAAFALGAGVLCNALMTDYHLGVARLYSFKVHGALDYGVAAASAMVPNLLDFADTPEAAYFYGQGGAESVTAALTNYDDNSGSERDIQGVAERYRVAA